MVPLYIFIKERSSLVVALQYSFLEDNKLYLFKSLENIKLLEDKKSFERAIKRFPFKNFTSLNAELKTDKIFPGVTICILDKKYEIGELIEKKVVLRRDGI